MREIVTMESLKGIKGIPEISLNPTLPDTLLNPKMIKSVGDLGYFILPWFKGNLTDFLPEIAKDDGHLAVQYAIDIARVVERLHQKNYAHRDLKPENILHNFDREIVVSDYGLSIELRVLSNDDERLTEDGELIGSVSYRAPELLRGRLDASDHRPCDVFSLGRILWAMIFGREPHAITDFEFQQQSVTMCGRTIRKSSILDDIIKSATSFDPRFRIAVTDFIQALENWKRDASPGTHERVIEKITNAQSTSTYGVFTKRVADIQARHEESMKFIHAELNMLIEPWRKVAEKYKSSAGQIGNDFNIDAVSYYSPDFSPEELGFEKFDGEPKGLRVRLNLDIAVAPRIQLAIYVLLNPTEWEGQKYVVLGGYIPIGTDVAEGDSKHSVKVTNSDTVTFDYRQEGIKQRMLADLTEAFKKLDAILLLS